MYKTTTWIYSYFPSLWWGISLKTVLLLLWFRHKGIFVDVVFLQTWFFIGEMLHQNYFLSCRMQSQHGILKSNNEVEDATKNPFLGKTSKYDDMWECIFVWPWKALNVKFCNWFFFREAAKSLANTFSCFVMALWINTTTLQARKNLRNLNLLNMT